MLAMLAVQQGMIGWWFRGRVKGAVKRHTRKGRPDGGLPVGLRSGVTRER